MSNRKRQAGFTLVEILIVVVILGILAAIVIPQFTQASESAKASSLVSQLQTIRSQLQLYQIQHGGQYPTLAQLQDEWEVMVEPHDWDGATIQNLDQDGGDLGPYLQQPPRNSFNNSTDVGGYDAPAATDGWAYDEDTGRIRAVVTDNQQESNDLNETDVVVAAP